MGRQCDDLRCSYSWRPEEHLKLTKGRTTVECYIDISVPLVAVAKQSATPSLDAIPCEHSFAWRKLRPKKVDETVVTFLEPLADYWFGKHLQQTAAGGTMVQKKISLG